MATDVTVQTNVLKIEKLRVEFPDKVDVKVL